MITNGVSYSRPFAAGGLSMKALPNLRKSTTRRRLRSLLPSAMMGLVTFSFTLLFVGAAAYAVSLPSLMKDPEGKSFVLLDAAGHTAGSSASGMWTSLFRQMMFGEDAEGAEDGSTAKAGASTGSAGSMTGISLSGLMSGTVANVETKKDEANSGQTPGSDADKTDPEPSAPDTPSKPDDGKDDTGKDDGGKDDSGKDDSGKDDTGKDDKPGLELSEADKEFRQWMLGRLTRLDELAAEVNSLTEEFNRCALTTDLATRQAAAARVEKANETIWSEFSKTLNGHSTPAGSQLMDQRSRLVGSYRCLRDYLGCLDAAWSSNLDFADPSQHVSEFMQPLTETMNESGQNKYLAEYGPKRAGIVL